MRLSGQRAQPSGDGRAVPVQDFRHQPVVRQILGRLGQPVFLCVGSAGPKREMADQQLLHDVVRFGRARPGAHGDMRLAVFQPRQPFLGAHQNIQRRMRARQIGHRQMQNRCQLRQGRDHQIAGNPGFVTLQPHGQLGELLFGRAGDLRQSLPRFGRRVAARMPLKQLHAQPFLQRIHMTDHGGMMHTQQVSRAADRSGAHHVPRRADLVPVFNRHVCAFPHIIGAFLRVAFKTARAICRCTC